MRRAAGLRRIAGNAQADDGLQRGDDAQLFQARNIGLVDEFDMFDAVAAVARAIGLARRFIAIKGAAHAAIADGVNADLQPMLVGAGGDFVELLRR